MASSGEKVPMPHNDEAPSFLRGRRLGALTIAVAILAGGSYWYQVDAQHDTAACQSAYNQAFAEQLTLRSNLFQQSDDSRDELLSGIGALILAPPTKDPDEQAARNLQFRHLFEEYNAATEGVEKARANTQLPPIPQCG